MLNSFLFFSTLALQSFKNLPLIVQHQLAMISTRTLGTHIIQNKSNVLSKYFQPIVVLTVDISSHSKCSQLQSVTKCH